MKDQNPRTTVQPSGTVTFLFTDIEGSTKLAQEHPDRWEALRARHHAILQSACETHHGYVFQIIGDAFCVAFHTAKDGLAAAIESQQKLQTEHWDGIPTQSADGDYIQVLPNDMSTDYRGYLTSGKSPAGDVRRVWRTSSASNTTADLTRDQRLERVRSEI